MLDTIFYRFILPLFKTEDQEFAKKAYLLLLVLLFSFLLLFVVLQVKGIDVSVNAIDFGMVLIVFVCGMSFTLLLQSILPAGQSIVVNKRDVIIRRGATFFLPTMFGVFLLIFVFNPSGVYFQSAKDILDNTVCLPANWTFYGHTNDMSTFVYSEHKLILSPPNQTRLLSNFKSFNSFLLLNTTGNYSYWQHNTTKYNVDFGIFQRYKNFN